jgi:hypothetical protein
MPRASVVGTNGYKCDICQKSLRPHDVFRVRCVKTVGHTGELKQIDSIGVCAECYQREFPYLCGRGLLRKPSRGKALQKESC